MESLNLDKSVKLLTFCIIIVFRLRSKSVTTKKMQAFFSACHFLRTIRRFLVKLTADFHSVPVDLLQEILDRHKIYATIDLQNALICGTNILTPPVQTPGWMLVQTPNKQICRWVYIVSLPIKRMGRNVIGSNNLRFNLFREEETKTLHIFPETVCSVGIPYASTIKIAVTASSDPQRDVTTKLKKFFESSKYVQENDYVNVDDSTDFVVKSIEATPNKTQQTNAGYLIRTDKSSLFQLVNEPVFKPHVSCKLKNNRLKSNLDSYENITGSVLATEPYSLSDYCQSMKNIIKPFLNIEKGFPVSNPTFLISGPSGSGKRTIVKTVAASLGLHFIESSSLGLLGESTKASELRIRNTIQNALQLSPAVLYFTNVQVNFIVLLC